MSPVMDCWSAKFCLGIVRPEARVLRTSSRDRVIIRGFLAADHAGRLLLKRLCSGLLRRAGLKTWRLSTLVSNGSKARWS